MRAAAVPAPHEMAEPPNSAFGTDSLVRAFFICFERCHPALTKCSLFEDERRFGWPSAYRVTDAAQRASVVCDPNLDVRTDRRKA
jgi:hypothetical protein